MRKDAFLITLLTLLLFSTTIVAQTNDSTPNCLVSETDCTAIEAFPVETDELDTVLLPGCYANIDGSVLWWGDENDPVLVETTTECADEGKLAGRITHLVIVSTLEQAQAACDDLSPNSLAADYALFMPDLAFDMHMCVLAVD